MPTLEVSPSPEGSEGRELRWRGAPVVLVPVSLLVNLVLTLKYTFGSNASALLYISGYQEGKRMARELKQDLGNDEEKDGRSLFQAALDLLHQAGWGTFRIINWDPMGNLLVVESEDPAIARFIADHHGNSGVGVEDLHRGLAAGVASVIFAVEMDAYESHCRARGHPFCRIEIRPVQEGY